MGLNDNLSKLLFNSFTNLIKNNRDRNILLYDLATVVDNRGKTPPLVNKSSHPLIDVRCLNSNKIFANESNASKYVSDETYNTWFRNGHPKKGDTLLSTVGTIGESSLFVKSSGTIAQNVVALRPIDTKGIFLFELIRYIKPILTSYNIGSVQPSIKVTQFMKQLVTIPTFEKIKQWEIKNESIVKIMYNLEQQNSSLKEFEKTLLNKYF